MKIEKHIKLDFSVKSALKTVFAKQSDDKSRYVYIQPLMNGVPWVLPEGVSVLFCVDKPDGHSVMIDGATSASGYPKVDNGEIVVELTAQTLAAHGMATASISLVKDDAVLSTQNFLIDIEEQPAQDNLESSDEYQAFTGALQQIAQAKEDAETAVTAAGNALEDAHNALEEAGTALERANETSALVEQNLLDLNEGLAKFDDLGNDYANAVKGYASGVIAKTENISPVSHNVKVGITGNAAIADKIVVRSCGKNFLPFPYYENSKNINGIDFSVNENGSISVNGANAGGQTRFQLANNLILPVGKYFIKGLNFSGSNSSVYILVDVYKNEQYQRLVRDIGNGVSFELFDGENVDIYIAVGSSYTEHVNFTSEPMLILPADTSSAYIPYVGDKYEVDYFTNATYNIRSIYPDMNIYAEMSDGVVHAKYNVDSQVIFKDLTEKTNLFEDRISVLESLISFDIKQGDSFEFQNVDAAGIEDVFLFDNFSIKNVPFDTRNMRILNGKAVYDVYDSEGLYESNAVLGNYDESEITVSENVTLNGKTAAWWMRAMKKV